MKMAIQSGHERAMVEERHHQRRDMRVARWYSGSQRDRSHAKQGRLAHSRIVLLQEVLLPISDP